MLKSILQMVEEISKCEKIGAWNACLIQVYAYIDALSYLDMPSERNVNTRQDYIAWVDKYMKCHPSQIYQYCGKDLYGARCAVLHQFSSTAEFHTKYPDTKKFGYHDGGSHAYDPSVDNRLVIIGLVSLVNDFKGAVLSMLESHQLRIQTEGERKLLEKRLSEIIASTPI